MKKEGKAVVVRRRGGGRERREGYTKYGGKEDDGVPRLAKKERSAAEEGTAG